MFDIGFGEFMLVAAVALVIVGPSRLPQTARFLGHLYGRLQRQINEARADIKREMAFEDVQSIRREYEDAARNARAALGGVDRAVREEAREIEAAASIAPPSASSAWPQTAQVAESPVAESLPAAEASPAAESSPAVETPPAAAPKT